MKLNEKQFSMAVSVISSDVNRLVMMSLYKDNVKKYNEIRRSIEKYKNWNGEHSGKSAYYIRHLDKVGIIRKDAVSGWWYLTRLGIQITELISKVQNVCMEYDMNDVSADGKIMVRVQR